MLTLANLALHVGIAEGFLDQVLKAFDAILGGLERGHDAVHGVEHEAVAEHFLERGRVGIVGITLGAAHGDDADILVGLEVHHGREPCGYVVAEERRHDFRSAVVGHIGEVGFGEQLHHVGVVEALGRKRAGAGEAVLAAFGLGLVHEILHAGDAGIGTDTPAHREDVVLVRRARSL